MLKFELSELTSELERLPVRLRVAFAAACAERQRAAYRAFRPPGTFAAPDALERALDEVWRDPPLPQRAGESERELEEVMSLIPQEDQLDAAWTQDATNAQNAGMTVAYALRARLTGEAKEAAWAGQVAYEALDNFVVNTEAIDTNLPGEEQRVLRHPLIQAELQRQARDLSDLRSAPEYDIAIVIARIRERAKMDAPVFFGPTVSG